MSRFVRNRLRSEEILDKAARVRVEEHLNPLVACRFEDEPSVMKLVYAIDDFLVVVRRSVWMLLPC